MFVAIDRTSKFAYVELHEKAIWLKGLTPYEFICKKWAAEPTRFRLDPTHQMPGLNI